MMAKLKVLQRVKQLKESQALRALQKKRQEVAEAERLVADKEAIVADSARSLEARKDAVFAEIIGAVVSLDRIDEAKGRVLQLEADHQKLIDDVERARHVHTRLKKELEEATLAYRKTLKDREKYDILTTVVADGIALEQGLAEENEIEDLFAKRRKAVA